MTIDARTLPDLRRIVGRVAALALLALALAPGRTAAAQDDEETYESPNYGYSLSYDTDDWEVRQEDDDPDDAYDLLSLTNDRSNVSLIGDPDYDADALDDCLEDYQEGMTDDAGYSDVEVSDDRDAEGEDDDRVWTTVTYTFSFDDGQEDDFARYLECRAVGDGVTLVIIHDVQIDDYEDEIDERDDLLDGLDLPDADTRDDDASDDDDSRDDDGNDNDATAEADDDDANSDSDSDSDADDAEIAEGDWVGESEDGERFVLTVQDGGVSAVSYAYECDGEPVFAGSAVSDPAPIEDGEFEMVTNTTGQTTTVTGTISDGEAEGTLTIETTDEDDCPVELDWTAEEP